MTATSRTLLLWGPRLLGIALCLFLSLFALDAFRPGRSILEALPAFFIHLSPVLLLLLVVAVSWHWEWVGALVFTALAIAYGFWARDHVTWILAIGGPMLVVGLLFAWSWRHRAELRGHHG
jgi:hypothetical protein